MKKAMSIVCLFAILTASFGLISCSSGSPSTSPSPSPSSTLDINAIRAYADPATETTLQGLSEDNLAKYTQYADAQFKAALTQQVLDKTASQITAQLGTYQSKEFLRAEEQQGYILVHYKAQYSKGSTGVRMVFDKDHLVAGQWFE